MRSFVIVVAALVGAALVAAACGGRAPTVTGAATTSTTTTTPPVPTTPAPTSAVGAPPPTSEPPVSSMAPTTTTSPPMPGPITIAVRLERRTADEATADFESVVAATLTDPRGWERAAFTFEWRDDGPYRIVLAEGDEVDRLCHPYDTHGTYSCQNGPVVAMNADRWRTATPKWTGDLADYRRMLVNHEVGHLLGMRHPRPQCPRPGEPAPIMNQQSTELDGCLANPWPLDREIADAGRHDRKLAPGYGE